MSALQKYLEAVAKSGLIEGGELARRMLSFETPPGTDGVQAFAEDLIAAGLLTRWQHERLLSGRGQKFLLGQYKILGLLGAGGMGKVYLAEHVKMRRRVAIKVLPSRLVKDPAALERFHREAQAIAAVDHPHIVQAFSVDNAGDVHYLVMQYVEGRDLEQIVQAEGPLAPERAARYVRQAADGLAHAHARGLIHRDVKPANLLIDAKDNIRILDLGLARWTTSDEDQRGTAEQAENVVGTTDFLAPEQALGNRDIDGRADIYALGCTLHFLLTGAPPFPGGSLAERLVKHQMEPPPRLEDIRPDVPPELAEICRKMMAKQPADRQASAEEVSAALRAMALPDPPRVRLPPVPKLSSSSPSGVGRASPSGIGRKDSTRLYIGLAAGGVAAVAVLLLAMNAWVKPQSPALAGQTKNVSGKPNRGFVPTHDQQKSLWPDAAPSKPDKPSATRKPTLEKPVTPKPEEPKPAPPPPVVPAVVDLSRSQSVFANVEEARDYTLVYALPLPDEAKFNRKGVPYTVDNRPEIKQPFDRVAYYLELQVKDQPLQYAYASFDALTQDLAQIGVPTGAILWQTPVKNLNVFSNAPGVATGTGLTGGVEFWGTNYGPQNVLKVPGATEDKHDFGDARSNGGDYGSLQVHNYDARQTILAYNRWGGSDGEGGIGNAPKGHPDWTFSSNLKRYVVRNLYVLVRLPK